jgi:hypothetical protein
MPGIVDCIGVVGWAPTKMVCTHLTPGLDQTEFDDTFEALRNVGGNWASCWYVIGALKRHFVTSPFLQSRQDIKQTFQQAFTDDALPVMVLDATAEQATLPMQAMDLRFQRTGNTGTFSYCRFGQVPANAASYGGKNWTAFQRTRFARL